MNILRMAERLNMTPRAIRFYEEKGLLKPQRQQDNRYRIYTETDAWRLQTIGSLRELGISLEEIKRLINELDSGDANELPSYLNVQRGVLFQRWTEMKQLLTGLDTLIAKASNPEGLVLEDLFHLAEEEKRMKTARADWKDLWNFNGLATEYDTKRIPVPISAYERVLEETVSAVNAKQGERGVDLGTGTGNLAGKLLERGVWMAGVDQSLEMLRKGKLKYPELETKLGNLMSVPYFNSSFDFVVSSFALQHLTEEQKPLALLEMTRILRTYGRVCLADLMFVNEEHRIRCMEQWKQEGNWDRLHAASNKHYAIRTDLLEWFRHNQFIAYVQPIDEEQLLHLIVAVKQG